MERLVEKPSKVIRALLVDIRVAGHVENFGTWNARSNRLGQLVPPHAFGQNEVGQQKINMVSFVFKKL